MLNRLDELERQKDQIEARLAKVPPPLPRIHPNVAGIYRAKIQHLATIPSIGPITASAMSATIADPHQFKSGRHLGA